METKTTAQGPSRAIDVYAVRCTDYDQADRAISQLIDRMGGFRQFAAPGEHIALKVNLLRKADPGEAVTTHPNVVKPLAELIRDGDAHAVIVDSPGGGYRFNRGTLRAIYHATGMREAAASSGAELNYDTGYEIAANPEGRLIKRFELLSRLLSVDGVINVCKLKTHTFMHLTGAVKNLFGAVPGHFKPGYHGRLTETGQFAGMLLDLAHMIAPRLTIMDAVVAMEGDGPSAGTPVPTGWMLAATSPLAIDVVAGYMTGLSPGQHPLLMEARARGDLPHHMGQIRIIGAAVEALRIPGFKLPSTVVDGGGHRPGPLRGILDTMLKNSLSLKPRIDQAVCVGCGACAQSCPVEAITMVEGKRGAAARLDEKICIRCYCCHEMCPERAVQLKASWRYRMARSVFLAR